MGDSVRVKLLVRGIDLGLTNHPGQLNLAIHKWLGAMSTSQRMAILCRRGVPAGMARVWWQVKLCEPL